MKTVSEVSKISGVSIRALHYYDSVGLLKPAEVTESGYRLYGEKELYRLQTILLYKEIGLSLADIKAIIDNPDFDFNTAIKNHIEMLKLRRNHIDELIIHASKMLKGENADFKVFDRKIMENYAKEVKERWGETESFKESAQKLKDKSEDEKSLIADGLMDIFKKFGEIKGTSPESEKAQNAVKELKNYITENYYNCTNEILQGLSQMYVLDKRFRENIDNAGGEGTAEFVREAISAYIK